MQKIIPVILAGGSGTRLWPLSRKQYPKQFLKLGLDQYSLLQTTLQRLKNLPIGQPIIVCNEEHRFLVAEQIREIGLDATIILEPSGKNTAPAITLAALSISYKLENSVMLVLAADHLIQEQTVFEQAVMEAMLLANKEYMVTFGIVPTSAETGYGYIRKGKPIAVDKSYLIEDFVEKPDLNTAQLYFASQEFLWNSGMFMFQTHTLIEELNLHAPDILQCCTKAINNKNEDLDFVRIKKEDFEICRSESIDYALMEKTNQAAVIPLNAGWSDVGSWSALWDIEPKDKNGNVVKGDAILQQSYNNYCYADSRLVTLLGVENLVVVETKDAVLISNKNEVQNIKNIVETIRKNARSEHECHREVYRPWGKYDSIAFSSGYQVKHITVNPGQKLSLQMHHHRSEHWVVVNGTAKIYKNDESFILTKNQSVYIPLGERHSLENPGKIPLELIEVQSGDYLEEDDIVRFEDIYGRD